jgi:hypothetical protein
VQRDRIGMATEGREGKRERVIQTSINRFHRPLSDGERARDKARVREEAKRRRGGRNLPSVGDDLSGSKFGETEETIYKDDWDLRHRVALGLRSDDHLRRERDRERGAVRRLPAEGRTSIWKT